MISLANGPDPSACVAVLTHSLAAASPSSQSKDDGGSFALSSRTFEALNRVTLAYALARTGQRDVAIAQLERVARLIELDRGRTPYFAKVKKRARLVVEKRSLGTIRGINDEDDDDDREGGTQMRPSTSQSPSTPTLDSELLVDLSELTIDAEDEAGQDEDAKMD
ncbi:hypothetical protein JCM3766R1_005940 [Sporobolomyces carnicolor]